MFNVGGGELIVILVLGLILLGPDRLPEVARQLGKHLATYHRLRDGFTAELRDAMDPIVNPAPPIVGDDTGDEATSRDGGELVAAGRGAGPHLDVTGPTQSFA